MVILREHGGPDALGMPRWDFSSNANACGPAPHVLHALTHIEMRHYPDPSYAKLKHHLAQFHDIEETRLVLASSASEFVMRITAHLATEGKQRVWVPPVAYGEYAHAADVFRCQRTQNIQEADLCWLCDPNITTDSQHEVACDPQSVVVIDRAYEPLRLSGHPPFTPDQLNNMWQLWSPNKALSLTGIRGAYAIAPPHQLDLADQLKHKAPSWVLGAHAVEMLSQWTHPRTHAWLAECRATLQQWKVLQMHLLKPWFCLPSSSNFFCMKAQLNHHVLREHGVKLRDASSLGLPGHWRLSVQPPAAQAALHRALTQGGAQ